MDLTTLQIAKNHTNMLGLNVKDFGAKGDGVTNDTEAFERAEKALPSTGGAIFVPQGTYIVSYRVRKANVKLYGAGYDTILKTPPNATKLINDCPLRIFADHCIVRDLKIDGNKANNQHLMESMATAREADGIGIYANYCTVENVWVHGTIGHHIIVWNDNFNDENHPAGARHHNSVRYCIITELGMRNPLDFASTKELGDFDTNINHHNEIIGNKVHGHIVIHTGWDTLVQSNIVVDGNIIPHTGCRRIHIKDNIVENGNINLQGGSEPETDDVRRRSKDIVCEGNTVRNSGSSGIAATAIDGLTVRGNKILNASTHAVLLRWVTKTDIENNHIVTPGDRGIYQTNVEQIEDIKIANNTIDSVGSYAVEMSNVDEIEVLNNKILNGGRAIMLNYANVNNGRINNNVCKGQSSQGIDTTGNNFEIKGNRILDCGHYAVTVRGDEITITNNILNNSLLGINLETTSTNVVVTDNRFTNANHGTNNDVIVIKEPTSNPIVKNNIIDGSFVTDGTSPS